MSLNEPGCENYNKTEIKILEKEAKRQSDYIHVDPQTNNTSLLPQWNVSSPPEVLQNNYHRDFRAKIIQGRVNEFYDFREAYCVCEL
jgi:hypothetical protein